ncbi:MAG: hypothetical protein ACLFP8_05340 [Alphaproteobacteria bacterium]
MPLDRYSGVKIILTSIEGIMTGSSYSADVMDPYITKTLPDYIWDHETDLADKLDEVRTDERNPTLNTQEVIEVLLRYQSDAQHTSVSQTLRCEVLSQGYKAGFLDVHIYEDALRAVKRWHDQGRRLYACETFSKKEQDLLLASAQPNISTIFSGFFELHNGEQTTSHSYERIAAEIGLTPSGILYLTDDPEEALSASDAGMKTIIIDRQNSIENAHGLRIESDCDRICLQETVPA